MEIRCMQGCVGVRWGGVLGVNIRHARALWYIRILANETVAACKFLPVGRFAFVDICIYMYKYFKRYIYIYMYKYFERFYIHTYVHGLDDS